MAIVLSIQRRGEREMALRSLQGRLLVTFVSLMILGLGGVIVSSGLRLTAQTLERNEHDLQLQAALIANALRDPVEHLDSDKAPTGRTLGALITSYAQGVAGRVTLLDPKFKVIASSDLNVPLDLKEAPKELLAARDGQAQSEIRMDAWQKAERMFVAAPILSDHEKISGYVQLSIPMQPIYGEMLQTWLSFIGIGLIVLCITVIASVVIARQIAVPVQQLTVTSEQIAAGRLDERVAPAGPSEIQRLGVAFNRMSERVQAMLAQQRAFVDNAAHELRSPLTSIRLRIEMLQTRGKNNVELTQHYLGQMEREVGYLQRMVDQLLALASLESQDYTAPRAPLDLAPLLYEVADQMSAGVRQAGLALQSDIPAHLPLLQANADQIITVVRNLIDNAIKYSRAGGTITLNAKSARDEIEIQVVDTGSGIAPAALPHIFERFYRADVARAGRGTGLGLALAQTIVQAHGGRLEAASRVGEGSTFTIHLPLGKK